LTDNASVSSGNVTFINSAGVVSLAAGESKTITVMSTIYGTDTSGQTVGISINASSDITTEASSINGTFPMSGNLMSIASATLATVYFANTTYPSSDATINPQDDYVVWKNTVAVGTRKVDFNRISVKQIGTVDSDDVSNFRLYVDGVLVGSTVASMNADKYVTFDLSGAPVELKTGNREVKILGDIVGGSYKNFKFSLKKVVDASFTDSQYSVDILPTAVNTSTTFSSRNTASITISTGTITVTKMSGTPSSNIVKDDNSVLLGKFELKAAGEDVKIETLRVFVTASSSANSGLTLRNGYLEADGVQVGSTAAILEEDSATGYTEYTVNLTVAPGSPATLDVYADIYDASSSASLAKNDTLKVSIYGATDLDNATGQTSDQIIDAPSATVAANTLTVTTGTMALAEYGAWTNRSLVSPVTAYKFGHFTLTGNSTEAVNLSEMKVQFTSATTNPAQLTNVYVVYGSKTGATKATVATTTNATTSEELTWAISEDLAKNETINVEVYGTLSSAITDGSLTCTAKFTGATKDSGTTIYTGATEATYTTGQVMTLSSGTFAAAIDGDTPLTDLVQGNQTVTTAKFKFTATNDTYTIEEVKIEIPSAAAVVVQSIKLLDGTTVLGTLSPDGSYQAHFTGLTVSVPANTEKVLTAQLVLGTISDDYSQSGINLQTTLAITSVKYSDSNGTTLTDLPAADVDANSIYVYKSIPTVARVALTGTPINGNAMDLYEFTVSAPSTGSIGLYKVSLGLAWSSSTVNAPSLSTLKFYRGSTELTTDGIATTTTASATEAVTSVVYTFPSGETVAAGTSYTYTFRATPAGFDGDLAASNADNLSIWLKEDTAYIANAAATVDKNFVWSDNSALSHATTTTDWTGGYKINDLPLDSQAWSK